MHIKILAIGKNKTAAIQDLVESYRRRMLWSVELEEIEARKSGSNAEENTLLLSKMPPDHYIIALDERGKSFTSPDFAKKLGGLQLQGHSKYCFIIGGADGLNEEIRGKAQFLLSFGKQTWPHMLIRVMLMEQLYRGQQILSGHPYHRN